MRYGVTGAAGFIGSHLCHDLVTRGHEVIGFDCFTDYYAPELKKMNSRGLNVRCVDLATDPLDFGGLDGLFHLAAQPGVRSFGDVFRRYVRDNVLATQRVYEAAAKAGIRVVLASTSSVYGQAARYPTPEKVAPQPVSPYGITKLSCEHLAWAYRVNYELDCVVIRYFTVYGPRQRPDMAFTRLIRSLAAGLPFALYGDGNQSRSFTFVSDAIDATIRVMESGEGIFNVGGASEATISEIISRLEEISGSTLNVTHAPAAKGDVRRTAADTTRLRTELGWRPTTPLDEGLARQWEWVSRPEVLSALE